MRNPTLLASVLLAMSASVAQTPSTAIDFHADAKFQKQYNEAKTLSGNDRTAAFAGDAWRKANKLSGNRCFECMEGALRAEARRGDPKRAAEAARAMDGIASTPQEHSIAETYLGQMLLGMNGEKPKPEQLQEAHTALQAAVKAAPSNSQAWYTDGRVLARLNDDKGASEDFQAFLAHARREDPLRTRAAHFAENPALARLKMAPPLIVDTLAGKRFNLDEMNGKVVLIDFWATWCGPCKQEVPHMQQLAQRFASEPFEVISVSWDKDEAQWKDFIAQHSMTWNQYRDADHSLSTAFNVDAIPHYFTIDSDGVLTAENVGSGSNIEDRIRKLIRRAHEMPPATAPAPQISSTAGLLAQ